MSYQFIPEGFQTVSPFFIVDGPVDFIEFLKQAFNAEMLYQKTGDTGSVEHALLKVGNAMIELSEATPAFPAKKFACQVFVPDCDEVYKKAIEAGAESIGEPSDMPCGLRAGYVKDTWGNQWFISTQIKNRYNPRFWKQLENFTSVKD